VEIEGNWVTGYLSRFSDVPKGVIGELVGVNLTYIRKFQCVSNRFVSSNARHFLK